MDAHSAYSSPFSRRYAGARMQYLYSDRHRVETWRRLWVILAESEMELGLPVTREQIEEMKAHIGDIDFDAARLYEEKSRHDVMAHIRAFGDVCPRAKPIIHLGATSCYVGDNADILIMREALQLLRGRLADVARALYAFAGEHKGLPTLAFTHFQPAQPTTVGKRAALWLKDVLDDVAETEHALGLLRPLGSKGTTGTQASFLELFGGDYGKAAQLDLLTARGMGFDAPVPVSGQTYSRKSDYRALSLLSQIAQTAHKFSNDIRLLMHLKEVEEPFEPEQVGSSAMPYKRNPMRCERMAGLARFLIVNAHNGALNAAEQWLERSLDDSANRRIAIAEGFLAADGLLLLFLNVASGLVVYPRMIEKHLREELPFMAVENILMRAVRAGGDRQALHERLRLHSLAAGEAVKREGRPNDLLGRVAADGAFRLTGEELEDALDPEKYIGCAAEQTERYLAGEAKAALDRLAGVSGPPEEVRV